MALDALLDPFWSADPVFAQWRQLKDRAGAAWIRGGFEDEEVLLSK